MITSSKVDEAALGVLLAAAVATLAQTSRNLLGFLSALVARFLEVLAESFPKFVKRLPSPSACFVLPLTIIGFFYLQIAHCPNRNLISSPVF